MENERTYTAADLVNFAAQKDAANLSAAFKDMISQRMMDAIHSRKVEVAGTMFNSAEEQPPVEASGEEESAAEGSEEDNQEQGTEEPHEDTEVAS